MSIVPRLMVRADAIAHQQLLNQLSNVDLLVIDDFLTVGIDHDAAADLFAILANRDHRLPTMIASQTGPAHWVAESPAHLLLSVVPVLVPVLVPVVVVAGGHGDEVVVRGVADVVVRPQPAIPSAEAG